MIEILFGLSGGVLIAVSQTINSRLAIATTAMNASFWNHLVGAGFMSLLFLGTGGFHGGANVQWQMVPWQAYLGGAVGVLATGAIAFLIGRMGASRTFTLVISGQVLTGVVMDGLMHRISSHELTLSGTALILAGIGISFLKNKPTAP